MGVLVDEPVPELNVAAGAPTGTMGVGCVEVADALSEFEDFVAAGF